MSKQYFELSTNEKGLHFYRAIPDPAIELQHSLTQALNEADELRAENRKLQEQINSAQSWILLVKAESEIKELNHALTSIAKQLGFDYFDDKQVAIAIEELQYSKIESENWIKDWKAKCETAENTIATLQDNLTRSQSDHLSELTSIMRMIQAWESVPIQKWSGALYLVKRVIYDQICRLDPTQSWDI